MQFTNFNIISFNRCIWPSGKVMGGSSSINYMVYARGNRRDYDRWAEMGNTGWSYDDVLPYFIKSEDNKNPNYAATQYHGTGGYLTVSEAAYKTPLADGFMRAGRELGYQVRDCNGQYQTGFMIAQGTVRGSTRVSSSKAFLIPARNRTNLHVSKNSRVLRLLIDPKSKRAIGVEFEKSSTVFQVYVTKEVILSAGTKGSAKILLLSGIGPAQHLYDMGIQLMADLPVGQNLQVRY